MFCAVIDRVNNGNQAPPTAPEPVHYQPFSFRIFIDFLQVAVHRFAVMQECHQHHLGWTDWEVKDMLFYFSGSQADYSAPSASGGCTGGDRIVRFASGRVRTVGAGSPSTHLCLRTHTKTIQAQKRKQSKVFKYSKLRKENFFLLCFRGFLLFSCSEICVYNGLLF